MTGLDWDKVRRQDQFARPKERPPVLGGRERTLACRHQWDTWESPPGTTSTLERACLLCGHRERRKLVLSDLAQTPAERARIRSSAKYRGGFARTTRGQQRTLHKQNGQTLRDQRPD